MTLEINECHVTLFVFYALEIVQLMHDKYMGGIYRINLYQTTDEKNTRRNLEEIVKHGLNRVMT